MSAHMVTPPRRRVPNEGEEELVPLSAGSSASTFQSARSTTIQPERNPSQNILWLTNRATQYDDGRAFNKIPDFFRVFFTVIFAVVGIHSVAHEDGKPLANHVHEVEALFFIILTAVVISGIVMQVGNPKSKFVFWLGAMRLLLLVMILIIGLLILWPL